VFIQPSVNIPDPDAASQEAQVRASGKFVSFALGDQFVQRALNGFGLSSRAKKPFGTLDFGFIQDQVLVFLRDSAHGS